jgi:short-subunit dehydrogenase
MLILQGRNADRLGDLALRCWERGAVVQTEVLELRDREELTRWLDAIGRLTIDLAIVNAGVTSHIGIHGEGESWESVENVIDVNIRAAMATVTALLPSMRRRGSGQIALISSLSAYYGLPITPAYCASKAALKAYGEALRGWLAPEGVAISVVLPGFVETGMSAQFPGPKAFVLRPETAAGIIRRGLARNQARIGFPFPVNFGMWWLSVLPPAVSQRILQALNYGGASPTKRESA